MLAIAFATNSWMLYAFMLPYAFSGLAHPAISSIMSNKTSENEQGELQGVMTSVLSISEIIGPPMMMTIFYFFSTLSNPILGMPFVFGSFFILIALILFRRVIK
jgi:DHA1 family tetracycline resistance protein-like MFS transporter